MRFLPLLFLAAERKVRDVFVVAAMATLTGGLGAWLFGAAGTLHVGASGVIFGWLGFVLGRGLFERRLVPIALSLVAMFLAISMTPSSICAWSANT